MMWTPEKLTEEDYDIAAKTIWGEARGEDQLGKECIAWVIRNRATIGGWFGDTPAEVCKRAYQFSCWNENDPNRKKLEELSPDTLRFVSTEYRLIIRSVALYQADLDPTKGSTHYCRLESCPYWCQGMEPVFVHGNHKFFNTVWKKR